MTPGGGGWRWDAHRIGRTLGVSAPVCALESTHPPPFLHHPPPFPHIRAAFIFVKYQSTCGPLRLHNLVLRLHNLGQLCATQWPVSWREAGRKEKAKLVNEGTVENINERQAENQDSHDVQDGHAKRRSITSAKSKWPRASDCSHRWGDDDMYSSFCLDRFFCLFQRE